ncbi:MAG: CpsD/CapB family tyrosine-protein kinase [Clostridiales bacterium]|nr:CpsD/CapB family tyrosine-protein kinase [Clostridiales bacterium]
MANIVDKYYQTRASVRESIKTLRTNVQFSGGDREVKTIMLTSPSASTGKTSVACFLGIAFAETGKSVLLVESDFRRPNLGNMFKQRSPSGLLQVLYGETSITEAAAETRQKGLYLMDNGGKKVANPVEVINSHRFSSFVEQARELYDIVIFDTPPLGAFIEPALLAAKADGTLLVLQPGRVQVSVAEAVVEQLHKANANILGAVFNNCKSSNSDHYYYYRYYNKTILPQEVLSDPKLNKRAGAPWGRGAPGKKK